MVAKIKVKSNSIELENKFQSILNKFPKATQKSLMRVSAYGSQQIRKKTQSGKLPNGGKFRPYSKEYTKSKEFRKKKNKFVDLTLYGNMFSALTFRATPTKGEIFFTRNEESKKAYFHHYGIGKLPKRPFFDIGKIDRKKMVMIFEKQFRRTTGIRL